MESSGKGLSFIVFPAYGVDVMETLSELLAQAVYDVG